MTYQSKPINSRRTLQRNCIRVIETNARVDRKHLTKGTHTRVAHIQQLGHRDDVQAKRRIQAHKQRQGPEGQSTNSTWKLM
jgi:hypothetical protein